MVATKVDPGRERGPQDGARRFTPVNYHFDTRANLLATEIEDDWEPEIQGQWRQNQASVRELLMHQFGVEDYEEKIQNFTDLGAAPWSVVALHNVYLGQVRGAFVGMSYYPALLGACGLGERILNQLVLTLREDYAEHDATKLVADKQSFDNWKMCIKALQAWGVFGDETAHDFTALMRRRHGAVHYRSELDSGDARKAALEAVLLLCKVIEAVFTPIGQRPHYFTGPIGRSYVHFDSENDPFINRFILPACVLVSPIFRFVPTAGGFDVYDDPDFGLGEPPLTDEEFAEPERASPQVGFPF
ncbi:MAG: hypothetical protein M3P23_06770 [Actinomycetota bacterium]|nr:hypothetical protein [Actinomycetota bacterium]